MSTSEAMDARTRALLDERSAALARRGGTRAVAEEGTAYLVCACGPERYGLALSDVAAIIAGRPCTPLPGATAALVGIVALSGAIVSVIDLARALGSEPGDTPIAEGHLVRLRGADPAVALAVERVLGVVHHAPVADVDGAAGGVDGFGAGPVSSYAAPGPGVPAAEGGFSIVDLPRLLRGLTS